MVKSIRWRIAIPYILLIVLVMLALGLILGNLIRQNYLTQLESELSSNAYLLSQALLAPLREPASPADLEALAQQWAQALDSRITIIDPAGNVLADSHAGQVEIENHLNRPEVSAAIQNGMGSSTRFSRTVGYEQMYVAAAVRQPAGLLGVVRISIPLQVIQQGQNSLIRTLIGVSLAATLAALLLAIGIAGAASRPLRELTHTAEQIAYAASAGVAGGTSGDTSGAAQGVAHGDQKLVNYSARGDEIAHLTQAFHAMSRQLSSQIADLEGERTKLSAVLAEISDGLLIVNPAGQIQTINRAAQELFMVSEKDATGRSLIEVLRLHQAVELAQAAQETGQTQSAILEHPARQLTLQAIAIPRHSQDPGSPESGAALPPAAGVLLL
ncbi:MAG TPA: PAS domain-containing protein, partial [Anaerolineales bacterium]|nr:PAS domain-containing protein [Anaerolineales bacterium]